MGKKFYKTDVFEMKEGQARRVGKVIVEKNLLGVKEVVSGVEMDCIHSIVPSGIVAADIARTGHYVFVNKNEINKNTVATPEEVISYVDEYENNPFKPIADEIVTKEQRKKTMSKARKIKRG